MVFPIMAAVQAGAGLLDAKKKEQQARRTNAARIALGEAPTADPGDGGKSGLMSSLGGLMGGMGQPKTPEAPKGPLPAPPPLPPPPPTPSPTGPPQGPPMTNPNSFVPQGTLDKSMAAARAAPRPDMASLFPGMNPEEDPNANLIPTQ